MFTDPLISSGRPVVACVRFRGNMFTDSLPGNGSVRHNICIVFIVNERICNNSIKIST